MSRSLLFGYSVAREDGKVIVTIEGDMAGKVMSSLSGHRSASAVPFPFGPLGSPSMGLTSLFLPGEQSGPHTGNGDASLDLAPTLAEVFGQGFDRSYDEYEARLTAYREILATNSAAPRQDVERGGGPPETNAGGDSA